MFFFIPPSYQIFGFKCEIGDELKTQTIKEKYLFDPENYGRIYAFVDFANVRQWAKEFWPADNKHYFKKEIDIKKMAMIIGCISPQKKFFYYGHYQYFPGLPEENPLNIKHRQSIYRIDKARKNGFTPRTKTVKEIKNFDEEGRFLGEINKCNLDIEITMDMLLKIEKYDTVFLWSGDSDFEWLLKHLQNKGKKIVIMCARNFLSRELYKLADDFLPADPLKRELEYIKIAQNEAPPT